MVPFLLRNLRFFSITPATIFFLVTFSIYSNSSSSTSSFMSISGATFSKGFSIFVSDASIAGSVSISGNFFPVFTYTSTSNYGPETSKPNIKLAMCLAVSVTDSLSVAPSKLSFSNF